MTADTAATMATTPSTRNGTLRKALTISGDHGATAAWKWTKCSRIDYLTRSYSGWKNRPGRGIDGAVHAQADSFGSATK